MAQRGTLEYYQDVVNDTTNPELVRNQAQKQIDRLASIGSAQVQTAATTGNLDPQIQAVLNAMQAAVNAYGGKSANPQQIKQIVDDEIAKAKIDFSQLLSNDNKKCNKFYSKRLSCLKKKVEKIKINSYHRKNVIFLRYGYL